MPAMKHYVTLSVIFLYRMCWLKGHEAEMKSGMVNIPTSPSRHFFLIRRAVARDARVFRIWSAGWWYQSAADIN